MVVRDADGLLHRFPGATDTIDPGSHTLVVPLGDSLVVWWWLGTSDYTAAPPTIKQPISLVAPNS